MKTKIEWCDYAVNPVKGLCPVACAYCYARRMYKRFKWNPEIRFEPEWAVPIKIKRYNPSRIFIGSTIELFGDWVKPEWMGEIFEFTQWYPENTFIFLTKQPQNLLAWSPFPRNCWVGVSATDASMFYDACAYLNQVKATVKYISFEPLLEQINGGECIEGKRLDLLEVADISWVIIGQQTPIKKATMPKIEWVQEIVEACDKAGIPVFLKNNLLELVNYDSPETAFAFNSEGYYRQEMPDV